VVKIVHYAETHLVMRCAEELFQGNTKKPGNIGKADVVSNFLRET
jgi:hypothetical protein